MEKVVLFAEIDEKDFIKENMSNMKPRVTKQTSSKVLAQAPPTYQRGVVPKYLRDRKDDEETDKTDEPCPEGHVLLPEEERKETLRVLRQSKYCFINCFINIIWISSCKKGTCRKLQFVKLNFQYSQGEIVWNNNRVFFGYCETFTHIKIKSIQTKDNRVTFLGYADRIQELNSLPVRSDTLRIKRRKMEIEEELKRIDGGIKVFQRPKVYVKINAWHVFEAFYCSAIFHIIIDKYTRTECVQNFVYSCKIKIYKFFYWIVVPDVDDTFIFDI